MGSHLLLLVLGAVLLIKSADSLVEFAGLLARRAGLSDLVIGLTLTSIGTSVPELAGAMSATLQGHSGLAIGSIAGSNIANIGLILATAALVRPFATDAKMHDRDGFVMLGAGLLVFGLVLDNELGRLDAALLLGTYAAYLVFLTGTDKEDARYRFRDFMDFVVDFEPPWERMRPRLPRRGARREAGPAVADRPGGGSEVLEAEEAVAPAAPAARAGSTGWLRVVGEATVVLLGCAGVAIGARAFVAEAAWFAARLGVPDAVVGLTLVAVGTSLPELTVALTAARAGRAEMVVGNVMGSNIANLLLVLGVCGVVRPLDVAEASVVNTLPILLFFSLGLLYVVRSGWTVTRRQAALVLAAYVGFLLTAVFAGWG